MQLSNRESKQQEVYREMARNLLDNLSIDLLYRLEVNFHINAKNMDSMLGRTAHILFLDNSPLMKMLVYRYKAFFL